MAQIINLRQVRKARTRADAETSAAENRAKFGRTKAQKLRAEQEAARLAQAVDGARLGESD